MNAIGVDYQASRSVVALREGRGFPPRVRSVGDGVRQLIPSPAGSSDNAADFTFWRALATNLYTFLGHVRPIADNGYEIVVATSSDADRIGTAANAAGLPDHACIAPTDALVARWLTEMTGWKEERGVAVESLGLRAERGPVIAIAVGESRTAIAAYTVSDTGRGAPRVDRGLRRELDSGYLAWLLLFYDRVRERLAEVGDVAHDATLFDSSAEFGAKLRATPRGKIVEWRGPWPDRLYAPLRVTREECESWGIIRDWMQAVSAVVGDFALGRTGGSTVRVLVGGIGAVWPFAADAVARWGDVWQTSAPWLDLAAGAAWWSEARYCFAGEAAPGPLPESHDARPSLAEPVSPWVTSEREPVLTVPGGDPETAYLDAPDEPAPDFSLPDDQLPAESTDQVAPPVSHDDVPPWERFGDEWSAVPE